MAGTDYDKTADVVSSINGSGSDLHVQEQFLNLLEKGIDKVWKREFTRPAEGFSLVRQDSMSTKTKRFHSYRGIGSLIEQNRDADEIPYDTRGEGFSYDVTTDVYRKGIAIEKTMTETDMYGVISNMQMDMAENAKTAVELIIADVFNRAIDPAGGAPVLAEDGLYLIDSDRPNAYARAPKWSNEESASAITASSIYRAQLNFAGAKDELGQLAPQKLEKIVIRPQDEQVVWELLKSDLRPEDSMNAKNFQKGRFDYQVYNYLTSANIFYLAGSAQSPKNELQFFWRVKPEFKTWVDGSNPDITRQRVRMAFGMGLGRPQLWRGGVVS